MVAELVEALHFLFYRTMAFWTSIFHCADRSFYVGHTDHLEARIAAHQADTFPGYTSTRLPVALVWSEHFPTRVEALAMERRLKGWTRAKELALIRGDWIRLSDLAKGRNGTPRTE